MKHIDIVVSMDHGKGHSRLTCNIISRWCKDDGEWYEDEYAATIGNAICNKDSVEIFRNTFKDRLNCDLMKLKNATSFKINREGGLSTVVLGGEENTNTIVSIPFEVFFAGDVLLYSMVLGKDGYSTWWCTHCQLFKSEWAVAGHPEGTEWSIEKLISHGNKVACGNFRQNDTRGRMGVRSCPEISAIPIENYVLPILHILIGKGNDILSNLTKELQAAAETYSEKYMELESDVSRLVQDIKNEKNKLARFHVVNGDYMRDINNLLKGRSLESQLIRKESPETLQKAEIDNEVLTREKQLYENRIETLQQELADKKKNFSKEAAAEENSKAFGQPLRAKIDDILRKYGIDRAAQFGGDIEGNGCRKLMENSISIVAEIKEYIKNQSTTTIKYATNEEIFELCDYHAQLLLCVDGYISCMKVKRFHLTDEIVNKRKQYAKKVLEWERYLGMSITTKSHLIEDHSDQQQRFNGIGDLTEDFGERNHQYEAKADALRARVRSFAKRQILNSQDEVRNKDPRIKIKAEEIKQKRTRETQISAHDIMSKKKAKRQQHIDKREKALSYCVPTEPMKTMRQRRIEKQSGRI